MIFTYKSPIANRCKDKKNFERRAILLGAWRLDMQVIAEILPETHR